MKNPSLYPGLDKYLKNIESEFSDIPPGRLKILRQISGYIKGSLYTTGIAKLVFVCTHNSRRSQFGQLWASAAAVNYGIPGIESYSGGTVSTAFNRKAVAAVERAGFRVETSPESKSNPVYRIKSSDGSPETKMFSKVYEEPTNPSANFCAIMVCADADEACPTISGATYRISLPYEDPKKFDGTGQEKSKYDERCREIARDLHYVFHLLR